MSWLALVVAVLNGERFDKPGEKIPDDTELKLKGEKLKYVSRGGLKLEKAMQVFDLSVEGATTIDIGASTGGFTDVMLQNGAELVFAVDVGTNQLAWKLRQDPRVVSMEQFNFRYAEKTDFEQEPSFASIDVSFISLSLILPALHRVLADQGQVWLWLSLSLRQVVSRLEKMESFEIPMFTRMSLKLSQLWQ